MYEILVRILVISALLQLGLSLTDLFTCSTDICSHQLESARQEVLQINWSPISVFPEQAKRFK